MTIKRKVIAEVTKTKTKFYFSRIGNSIKKSFITYHNLKTS